MKKILCIISVIGVFFMLTGFVNENVKEYVKKEYHLMDQVCLKRLDQGEEIECYLVEDGQYFSEHVILQSVFEAVGAKINQYQTIEGYKIVDQNIQLQNFYFPYASLVSIKYQYAYGLVNEIVTETNEMNDEVIYNGQVIYTYTDPYHYSVKEYQLMDQVCLTLEHQGSVKKCFIVEDGDYFVSMATLPTVFETIGLENNSVYTINNKRFTNKKVTNSHFYFSNVTIDSIDYKYAYGLVNEKEVFTTKKSRFEMENGILSLYTDINE